MPRLPSQLTYNDLNGAEAVEILTDWARQLLQSHPLMQRHLTLPQSIMRMELRVFVDQYSGSIPVNSMPDTVTIGGDVQLLNTTGGVYRAAVDAVKSPPDQIREQHELPVPRPGYGPRDTGGHLFLGDVDAPVRQPYVQPQGRSLLDAITDMPVPPTVQQREGIVAEGYQFAPVKPDASPAEVLTSQTIPVDHGSIQIDLSGEGIRHDSGIVVKTVSHRASVKEAGDQQGRSYSSVNGVLDAGPAGLAVHQSRGGGGLGTDGRTRISFGNNH